MKGNMTDRHIAYTVTLSNPVRSDDAQRIVGAIMMIRGVEDVVPVVASPDAYWVRSTARRDLLRDIIDRLSKGKDSVEE